MYYFQPFNNHTQWSTYWHRKCLCYNIEWEKQKNCIKYYRYISTYTCVHITVDMCWPSPWSPTISTSHNLHPPPKSNLSREQKDFATSVMEVYTWFNCQIHKYVKKFYLPLMIWRVAKKYKSVISLRNQYKSNNIAK